jgi:tRNA(Ile)-lysidine synthase
MSLKNLSVKIKIPRVLKNKLNNKKISQIYKKFAKSISINENFIVAVSGGPDSLALAFLSKIYSIQKNLKAKFYIIDHKLRSESTNEAKYVKKILNKFQINAQILYWQGIKPKSNIQSAARTKRFELLISECKKLGVTYMLLGHHQEDLIENFFIRILRGSGLKGLISLSKKTKLQNLTILRPLINQKKEDLVFISKKVFDFYVKDPTNNDEKFQRVRIRKLLNGLKNDGLDQKKFIKTIENLKKSNDVVNYYVTKNLENNSFFSHKKKHLILNDKFFKQPYEVVFRSLSDSLNFVSKKYYSVRGKKIDKIIKEIQKSSFSKSTLGSCLIEKVNQTVIISKEQ